MTGPFPGVRHFTAADVEAALPLPLAYASQHAVFADFARGSATLASRALLNYGRNTAFCYLARASASGSPVVKIGSVNPGNSGRGLPNVQATLIVLDATTGAITATLDGESVTLLRTAAASVVAMDALHRVGPDPLAVTIVGSGRQAEAHARAIHDRHPTATLIIVGRDQESATRFTRRLAASDIEVVLTSDGPAAISTADVVILCTTSATPVLEAAWLRLGATVVSIGSFAPDRCEFGADLIRRAGRVHVDDAETAIRQCGPIAAAVSSGALEPADVLSLGDVLIGRSPGRGDHADICVYSSVGLGIQDAAVADLLLGRAVHG